MIRNSTFTAIKKILICLKIVGAPIWYFVEITQNWSLQLDNLRIILSVNKECKETVLCSLRTDLAHRCHLSRHLSTTVHAWSPYLFHACCGFTVWLKIHTCEITSEVRTFTATYIYIVTTATYVTCVTR